MNDPVKVRDLEWEAGIVDCATPFPGMKYVACSTSPPGSWSMWIDGVKFSHAVFTSEAAAKAAAQADYTARILAALDLTAVEAMDAENKRLRNILGRIRDHIDDGTEEGHVQLDYIGTQMVDMLDDIRAALKETDNG